MDVPKIASLLLICIIFSSANGQCNIYKARPKFSRAIHDFTTEINSRLEEQTSGHYVASPVSLWSLLSAISEGAEGTTLREIQEVLHHHHIKCFNRKYYDIIRQMKSTNPETLLERSGLVVIDENLNVNPKFVNTLNKIGISNVWETNFENFEGSANNINQFVRNVTHGGINEIVSPEDMAGKVLILLDAIYFKGTWKQPFDSSDTEPTPFYNDRNEQIGDVNMMFNVGTYNILDVEVLKAEVLELSYGIDDRFSLLIFLPYYGKSLQSVIDELPNITIKSLFTVFKRKDPIKAHIQIPRFKITTKVENLKELLNDMGITSMFDSSGNGFSEITDDFIYVSDVVQKADIEVTEEGTTGSAITEAEFEDRMMPRTFTANKPFAFMIYDKVTEVVLFTGAYSKPSLF